MSEFSYQRYEALQAIRELQNRVNELEYFEKQVTAYGLIPIQERIRLNELGEAVQSFDDAWERSDSDDELTYAAKMRNIITESKAGINAQPHTRTCLKCLKGYSPRQVCQPCMNREQDWKLISWLEEEKIWKETEAEQLKRIADLESENKKVRQALFDLANDNHTGVMAANRARSDVRSVLTENEVNYIPEHELT